MGKVVKFTGSKLLGAELRRLRGGRSLKQISELSRTPPLSERCGPVAAPTLSQVENGISFPSLETLHSLSLIYQSSLQQLLDLVVQERLLGSGPAPADAKLARTAFGEAMSAGHWHEALRIAVWGERECSGTEGLSWRARRAQCLAYLGMTSDAVALLEHCLASPLVKPSVQYQLHLSLAEFQALSGHMPTARLHAREAEAVAPEDLSAAERLRVLRGSAYVLLVAQETCPNAQEASRAVRLLEQAASLVADDQGSDALLVRSQLAYARALDGNRVLAAQELEKVASAARAGGHDRVLVEALVLLGTVRREQRKMAAALSALDEAASLAAELGYATQAFEACFQAYRCVEGRNGQKAAHYLRRCERFHPLLQGRSPSVIRFEAAAWGEA